jgi:Domain of unknown function (DUF4349)
MQYRNLLMVIVTVIILFSCSANQNEKQLAPDADMLVQNISSSAAVMSTTDSGRHFLRTADIKFKVKDVAAATYGIENIVSRHGGFIRYTNLSSQVNDKSVVQVSPDSSMEITRYAVTNTITLSVPNNRLDNTLKDLAVHIDYLDYRVIRAEDVSLQLLSNSLANKRSEKFKQRMENGVSNNRKKLAETTEAENLLMKTQQTSDEAEITNLDLTDKVNFSTVKIDMYQNEGVLNQMVAFEKQVIPYQQDFFSAFKDSIAAGWSIIEYVVLLVVRLWAVILIGIGVYLLIKKYSAGVRWVQPKS